MKKKIGVLGAGSWGATLSTILSEKGYEITLWEFNPEKAKELSVWRSLKFFPHLTIPKDITITSNLRETVENKDLLIFAVPSHTLRDVAKQISLLKADISATTIVSATKGLETGSLQRMSEVIISEIPEIGNQIAVLSGPTHAEEVSQKIPTVACVASVNSDVSLFCQEVFFAPYFRIYTNQDIIGVEAGAALKNIFAIAAGISDGLGMGDNTKAALVTRGLKELIKLGVKMGGQQSTFFGLTGLGDLIVTCFSRHSRNRAIGEKIGRGKSVPEAEQEIVMVAEGVKTTKAAYELAKQYEIEVPIIEQVYQVIYEGKPPKKAVQELMTREAKPEIEVYDMF